MQQSINDATNASDQQTLREQTLAVIVATRRGAGKRYRPSPTLWRLALILGDALFLLLSLAVVLAQVPPISARVGAFWYEQSSWNFGLLWGALMLLFWSISAQLMRAQEPSIASSRLKTLMRAFLTLLVMFLLWAFLTYPFLANQGLYMKPALAFLGVATCFMFVWRLAFAEVMHLPAFRRYAVIVGTNVAGQLIHEELRRFKRSGTEVLGYISERDDEVISPSNLPILGSQKMLRDLVQKRLIDKIIMAIDHNANPALFQEAMEATQLGISIVPMATLYEEATGKIPVEHISDQWYIALPAEIVISPLYLVWRKLVDYTFGILGFIALGLLYIVVAPLIYLFSPGPIFYRQERVGYQGRIFNVYKFRSMYVNAEQKSGAMWAQKGDPRVTPIGRILRRTHLDELPQIINILRGDMSLIGPRPERETFTIELEKTIPFYRCRLAVKPGLTGWAQVRHHYTSSSDETLIKSQYDLYYIKHQCVTLDVYILLMTVVEMFLLRGR